MIGIAWMLDRCVERFEIIMAFNCARVHVYIERREIARFALPEQALREETRSCVSHSRLVGIVTSLEREG